MRRSILVLLVALGVVVVIALAGLAYVVATGLNARSAPSALETRLARGVRRWAIPQAARAKPNPVAATPEVIAEGMAHFADHCAVCHANDGSGDTEIGRNLFPKSPDMRLAATQGLTDGELFAIIENGVRFTGMPGWGSGTEAGDVLSWQLVDFIRHLPQITQEELDHMGELNPRSPEEIRQEIEQEKFLKGDDTPTTPTKHEHTGAHK